MKFFILVVVFVALVIWLNRTSPKVKASVTSTTFECPKQIYLCGVPLTVIDCKQTIESINLCDFDGKYKNKELHFFKFTCTIDSYYLKKLLWEMQYEKDTFYTLKCYENSIIDNKLCYLSSYNIVDEIVVILKDAISDTELKGGNKYGNA